MKIANQIDDQAILKYQRQNDPSATQAENAPKPAAEEQKDNLSINARGAQRNAAGTATNTNENSGELVGNLTDQIKDYSMKASRSHTDVDPGLVMSLFKG